MVRFLSDERRAPIPNTQPLLVIGAGLPRTATSSLQAALEELNMGPCLHMAQIIPHSSQQELLIAATYTKDAATRQKQLYTLISGYAARGDVGGELWAESEVLFYGYFRCSWVSLED
ncbi:hypothetical protein PENVUL_c056G02434 [Penicillium vulpinum]|uniref:Uncharacterized protein n=1 Tax=Penicillium vulpinum TaxID=29845 RepID=A0A1V6RFK2_9EURO|nr:hypothetical protein PENVUL_c056G02434 [Penicillium vulpinum]